MPEKFMQYSSLGWRSCTRPSAFKTTLCVLDSALKDQRRSPPAFEHFKNALLDCVCTWEIQLIGVHRSLQWILAEQKIYFAPLKFLCSVCRRNKWCCNFEIVLLQVNNCACYFNPGILLTHNDILEIHIVCYKVRMKVLLGKIFLVGWSIGY